MEYFNNVLEFTRLELTSIFENLDSFGKKLLNRSLELPLNFWYGSKHYTEFGVVCVSGSYILGRAKELL